MRGPRVYWNNARWLQWTQELKHNKNLELSIFPLIVKELTIYPERREILSSNPIIPESRKGVWSDVISKFNRVPYRKLINQ